MNIITNRLKIRLFKQVDRDAMFEMYRDEETCRFLLHEPWTSSTKDIEFQKKLSENSLTRTSPISLACELGNVVIGDISIWYTDMTETVEIGFVFNKDYAGKGYATEALTAVIDFLFTVEKVHRIQANLDSRNISSAKLCERLGMRQEAHFIEDYWNKGEWTDSFVYGMLKSDLSHVVG